jgi:hypothetical protein
MPIFFIIVALIMIVSGVRGTTKQLYTLFASDAKAFIAWFFIIVVLGMSGISKTVRPVSNAFLVLVIVVFFLKSGSSIFTNLNTFMKS